LLLRKLYPYLPGLQSQSDSYLRSFFKTKQEDLSDPFFSHLPRWNLTAQLKGFFSSEIKSALKDVNLLDEVGRHLPYDYLKWDYFSRAQYLETRFLMPGYILSSQGDRMAMAHSVEGRFPFLDYRIAEFASKIPPQMKMKVLDEKHILKQAVGDLIPDSIRRRPKQPYRAPEIKSFFDGGKPREEYVRELLSADCIRRDGIFDPLAVSLLVKKIREGRAIGIKDNMALVGILSTQLLIAQYVNDFQVR
jgi:asparagine synthase (glutamine-hydrolysing)